MAEIEKVVKGKIDGSVGYRYFMDFHIKGKPKTHVIVQECGKSRRGLQMWCVFYITPKKSVTLLTDLKGHAENYARGYIAGM